MASQKEPTLSSPTLRKVAVALAVALLAWVLAAGTWLRLAFAEETMRLSLQVSAETDLAKTPKGTVPIRVPSQFTPRPEPKPQAPASGTPKGDVPRRRVLDLGDVRK